ncbi:MAG: 6-phosphofructokinase [Nitrospirota bacterium]
MMEDLGFATIEGLLAFGEALARREPGVEGVSRPSPPPAGDRVARVAAALPAVRVFADRVAATALDAEAYRGRRDALVETACGGDALVFYAAWNRAVAEGALTPILRASIGRTGKPARRRPVAIVPRAQLTPHLIGDRIVLDLGDERFWLLPRDLTGRSLLFALRHGVSRVESGSRRVGRRLANTLDPSRGTAAADAVGRALAQMLGVIGRQLDFLSVPNYLDPKTFSHYVSSSPNTTQLYEHVAAALGVDAARPPSVSAALESQDFGWATGCEKAVELEEAARAFRVEPKIAKRLIKHPLYRFPAGQSFFDLYVDVVDGMHDLGLAHQGGVACVYTHSSTLRALMVYLDPRPFREAFAEFGEYKEGQDNVVLLTCEQGDLSGYSTAVGLSAHERATREAWITVERERRDRVTLAPRRIKRLVALVSGGDFAGGGAALKELRASGEQRGLAVYFVRHGFLGLANNWIERVTEADTRGMANHPSSPIGSSRFEDFKDERVQRIAVENLSPYVADGALVVMGGDGSLRGARALFEGFGVQVVGLPGTIDNNLARTTSLGFHSAVALANQSLESLKATSAAMGSVFFVEVMGAGSGHLALACAYQARAEGILVNEHPDPDAYIDEVILGTLRRSLGVPNKSHLFVVAERTPHRHHRDGGVHGLEDYVARAIADRPQFQSTSSRYPLSVATKATILGHTLRGAPPVPEDKALAQFLSFEIVRRVADDPGTVIGCMAAARGDEAFDAIPLHAVAPKAFDWAVFARMHGSVHNR